MHISCWATTVEFQVGEPLTTHPNPQPLPTSSFRVLIGWVSGASVNFGLHLSVNKTKVWGMLCLHSDVSFPFTSTAEYPGRHFHSNLEDFISLQTFRYRSKLLSFERLAHRLCKRESRRWVPSEASCLFPDCHFSLLMPRPALSNPEAI